MMNNRQMSFAGVGGTGPAGGHGPAGVTWTLVPMSERAEFVATGERDARAVEVLYHAMDTAWRCGTVVDCPFSHADHPVARDRWLWFFQMAVEQYAQARAGGHATFPRDEDRLTQTTDGAVA